MSEVRGYLRSFDDAWSHAWESVQAVLEGVSEEEAFWQAAAYADEPREAGWPTPGSIAWHVAHMAHCKRYYTEIIRRAGEKERPDPAAWAETSSFGELLRVLRDAHSDQRATIASLADESLTLTTPNDMSLSEFLAMCTRHDTWHAAQIAVARRLHRTRSDI